MGIFGSPMIQSITGIHQAERTATRDAERKKQAERPNRSRGSDEVELQDAQTTDAVRGVTGNAREETDEDRQRQGNPQRQLPEAKQDRPRLDVQG